MKKTELWTCKYGTRIGTRHKEMDLLCQDRVNYKVLDNRQIIGLVDGSGDTDLNVIAGEKVVDVMTNFILEHYDKCMEWSRKAINEELLYIIRRELEKISGRFGIPCCELKSTIAVVCIDHERDSYCAVHLGDGIIIGIEEGNVPIPISYPRNGYTRNETYLTTSEEAVKKMKVFRGRLGDMQGFMMCSDGVYEDEIDEKKVWKICEEMEQFRLYGDEKVDDQAVIVLRKGNLNVGFEREGALGV